MAPTFHAQHLDIRAFAQAGGSLSGTQPLAQFERLVSELLPSAKEGQVTWSARGEVRRDAAQAETFWLELQGRTQVPLTCQRCLEPVQIGLDVQRLFRFVASESQAESEDEESSEDVLVWSADFDVLALLEDEFLMELPMIPRHDHCPSQVTLQASDDAFDEASAQRPQPFAALAALKSKGSN